MFRSSILVGIVLAAGTVVFLSPSLPHSILDEFENPIQIFYTNESAEDKIAASNNLPENNPDSFIEHEEEEPEEIALELKIEETVSTEQEFVFSDGVVIEPENNDTVLVRPPSLYSFPPVSFEEINTRTREALVNIICAAGGSSLAPISASGVFIDSRGVILTNAHVGQYFLLEKEPLVNIDCQIRTGSPARSKFKAELVYLPSSWISEHAYQIKESMPTGTGENDWALLHVTDTLDGSPLPSAFPFLSLDVREAAGFTNDSVLIASYPAGFIGGATVQYNLFSVSTITNIKKLFTFKEGSVDLLSLGGVIVAQGGSSGGAVVNAWNQLIGTVVTSSDAETTAERDLRAITLAHIDRSILSHTGSNLVNFLSGDIVSIAANFQENIAPNLATQLVDAL